MPFELFDVAGRAADRVTGKGPLQIVNNPILAAMIVTVLAMVIIFACLGNGRDGADLRDVGWRTRVRCGLYLFFGTGVLLALHYYALDKRLGREKVRTHARTVFDQINTNQRLPEGLSNQARIQPASLFSRQLSQPQAQYPMTGEPLQPPAPNSTLPPQPPNSTLPPQPPNPAFTPQPPNPALPPQPPNPTLSQPQVTGGDAVDDLELNQLSFPIM